jgi:hypothetical protein
MITAGYIAAAMCVIVFSYSIFCIYQKHSTMMLVPTIAGTTAVILLVQELSLRVVFILLIVSLDFGLLPWISRRRNP